jgi:type I restriction enzyme S subunit
MSENLSQRYNEKEPTLLPRSWVLTTVRQLYDIVGGGTPSTAVPDYWQGDIPWITSADIHGLKDIRPRRRITEKAIQNSATNLVPKGSLIVVTRVGLGKVALASTPLCFSQDSQALVGNSSLILPDYSLYYLSQAVGIFKYQHRGTTINGVTKKQLADLEFALPPLNEQRRIVAKIEELFTKLDAGVKSLETVKPQLKRYRQSVLKSAFEGKLTEEWRRTHRDEMETACELLERIREERRKTCNYEEPEPVGSERLSKLPDSWRWVKLGAIADILPGQHILSKDYSLKTGGFPYLTGPADFGPIHPIVTKWTHMPKVIANPGSILITVKGAGVGKTNMLLNQRVAIGRQLMSLTPLGKIDPRYVYFFLTLSLRRMQESASGTTVPGLAKADISEIPVPLAPSNEQACVIERIETLFDPARKVEDAIETGLKKADALKHSILSKAFRGELIPQDPSDEPASVLLKRIKSLKSQMEQDQKTRKGRKTNDRKQRRLM